MEMITRKVYLNKDQKELVLNLKDFDFELLALDTETTSLRYDTQELIGLSICDGGCAWFIEYPLCLLILDEIKSKTSTIICHNITFDMKVLHKYNYDFYNKQWIDTMVMAHLLDENREHGLKYLSKTLLDREVITYEEAIKDKTKFYEYAIDDAINTYDLSILFKPLLVEQNLVKLFRLIEMPFLKTLTKMELNGVLVDMNKVDETTKELKELITELQVDMLNELGEKYDLQYDLFGNMVVHSPINFNSSLQLAKIITERLKLETTTLTKSGKPSMGKSTINSLKKEHKFVEFLSKFKAAQKLLNSFFEPMIGYVDDDGRIRPHYNDCGTVTGRLSCSEPNLQQLPKNNKELNIDTRSCFIVPQGKVMIACDYSQQELRIMAQLSKDEKLIKIINEGGDLHLINANNVFSLGIPEEKLYSGHPEYEEVKDAYKKERDNGKIFSFGVSYGMGEHKLSRDFKVTIEEAKLFLDRFFQGFPGLKKVMEQTHGEAEKNLSVSTYTGRRRRFIRNQWGKLDDKSLRQSFNFLIQSVGADLVRVACIKLDRLAEEHPEYDLKLIMTVHDEIVLECNEEYSEEVSKIACQLMESCAKNFVCALKTESGSGKSYSDAK
jgi:DNA polymerase-1